MGVETTATDLDEVMLKLKEFCNKFPTREEAATALGVSRVFLWKVLEGQANPTQPILAKIGFRRERIITYAYYRVKEDA